MEMMVMQRNMLQLLVIISEHFVCLAYKILYFAISVIYIILDVIYNFGQIY